MEESVEGSELSEELSMDNERDEPWKIQSFNQFFNERTRFRRGRRIEISEDKKATKNSKVLKVSEIPKVILSEPDYKPLNDFLSNK